MFYPHMYQLCSYYMSSSGCTFDSTQNQPGDERWDDDRPAPSEVQRAREGQDNLPRYRVKWWTREHDPRVRTHAFTPLRSRNPGPGRLTFEGRGGERAIQICPRAHGGGGGLDEGERD